MASPVSDILKRIEKDIADCRGIEAVAALMDERKAALFTALRQRIESPVAARALALKLQNLCIARFHLLTRGTTLLSRPYGLEVDPINNCNLACPGCVHSERSRELRVFDWTSGMITPERFAGFLERYGPFALQLTLCNYGEPTLNPHTPELIRLAKNYLLLTTLSTNMTSRRFDAEAYAASGLDFMTVSLDGATQSVYERFRRKGDLELAFTSIRSLVEAKRRLGKKRPFISWQFLAFEHNAHEIEPALAIARQLGVDQFRVAEPFDVSWDDPEVRPAGIPPVTYELVKDSEASLAANWNPFGAEQGAPAIDREFATSWKDRLAVMPEDVHSVHPQARHICHWLYKNMVMDANGRILPCCAAPTPRFDLVFANFPGASEDLFNTDKYRVARTSFADKSVPVEAAHPHCVDCDWFSDQQTAQIDGAQAANYLRSAGAQLFDARSLDFLTRW